MEMLNNSFVDTDCPPLAPFGEEVTEVKTDADCELEEVTEVETGKVKTWPAIRAGSFPSSIAMTFSSIFPSGN
jgi:hypothetical protein